MAHIRRITRQTMGERRVRGATMVETLVALIVLSIGLLGIASLFVTTIRASKSSMSRMAAVNLVADLSERIRVNSQGKAAYAGNAVDMGCNGAALQAVNCTPADMASTDLFSWNQEILAAWPGNAGTYNVTYTPGPPDVYTITLSWTEAGEPAPLSYSANFTQ